MTRPSIEPDADDGLWQSLERDPSGPARVRIFEKYLPFSRRIAARVRRERPGDDLDVEDLRQHAAEGLLQAIDRFDPDQGTRFEAFAARRIAGNVIDGIGASSEGRRQTAFRRRIRTERARSLATKDPDNLSTTDALKALTDLAVDLALGFMLDDAGDAANIEKQARSPNAYESLAWSDTVHRLATAVGSMPDPEGTVIRLHYLEGLEFARIADTLSLGRSRIAQIHAAALQRLRKRLPRSEQLHFSTVTG
ncbi:sigma-70 family RNA polymerase sigma factor [Brevundimonas sp.]|uniref:sigma-70 family RNA polymerase sigma factor n=1 Tax=Brevundimonas sp. TaxID=1871086 RepID=UPI002D62F5D8|nr:sigma-70 family RNA polymerase sigma factor [Brevundimonas sp.]HYC68860.1 sigma-70 family RNA polymerase sigma factor [Brevundimonas sp.]